MKTVNIMNFVRGKDPSDERDYLETPRNELKLVKQYGYESTMLVQYDALIRKQFVDFFKENEDDKIEFGLWFENCRQLLEIIGEKWDGRPGWDWDWYVHPGFLMGYNCEIREKLIDEVMRKFKEIFGYYPKTVGSWLLDSYSMKYMKEKYNVLCFAICREQFGIDAYTLWGGYYNGAYYPSVNNALCPAQTKKNSIDAPVFRLLGPDPIYCFEPDKYPETAIGCPTFEAYWTDYSGKSKTVEWYLKTYFKNPSLSHAYIQMGQENGFAWKNGVGVGFPLQLEKLKPLIDSGMVEVKKMCDTAVEFKNKFDDTPPAALIATENWADNDKKSAWFSCKNYRANVVCFDGELYFRDIHKFDEKYEERYLKAACDNKFATYDTLPIIDTYLFSTKENRSYLSLGKSSTFEVCENSEKKTLTIKCDNVTVCMTEDKITVFTYNKSTFNKFAEEDVEITCKDGKICGSHRGFDYSVKVNGKLSEIDNGFEIEPQNGKYEINFD